VNPPYDLAVVGGGPAGTSAAITAAQLGFRVLLLEAGIFPRHKVCGEFISAESIDILRRLLGREFSAESVQQVSKARLFVDNHLAEVAITPPAVGLSRYVLDNILWEAATCAGVEAHSRARAHEIRRCGESFSITASGHAVIARAVIDASGRWSNLRQRTQMTKTYIGLKGHFHEKGKSESCDLYFFAGGYCGVQPLGGGQVNAAAMVDPAIARNLTAVFAQHPALAARAKTWMATAEPVTTAPIFFAPARTRRADVALAGDAAAFIDPFAGDGISLALHSGKMAALALCDFLSGKCPLNAALGKYDSSYRQLIEPALANAARIRSLLRLPKVLRSGAVSLLNIPVIGRAVVHGTRVRCAM
jgi:flavin-dependent dehydrogenase